jgi:hypothetical protein
MRRQEEPSFCEQATAKWPRRKEAKKLSPFGAGSTRHAVPYGKKFFCFFFFKKRRLLLPLAF